MAVLDAAEKAKIDKMHPVAEDVGLGARLAYLDEAGLYTGALSDAMVLAEAKIVIGDAGSDGLAQTMSGDATIIADGTLTIGAKKVTVAKSADAIQDLLPNVAISAVDGTDGTAAITIQLQDGADNALGARGLVRAWVTETDWAAPQAQTGFSVDTGTLIRTLTANADVEVATDATGLIELTLDHGAAGSVYVIAELDGVLYSSGEIVITSV